MTQKDKTWWEAIRARGFEWFLLREGILRYGMQAGFWLTLFGTLMFLAGSGRFPPVLWLFLSWAFLAVFLGPFIGVVLWNQHEKNYQEQKGADHEG